MIPRWMAQQMQQQELADHGVRYAWVVTHEHDGKRWKPIEGGTVEGPSTATPEEIKRARLHGTPMRMDYDGDGPALRGHLWCSDAENAWDSEAAFQPLEDYGEGGYGCTSILFLQNGKWVQL